MVLLTKIAPTLFAANLAFAKHDSGAKLNKPPLRDDLNYLKPHLDASLPKTGFKHDQWAAGLIPKECKFIAEGNVESSIKYKPKDFKVFNVHYDDCGDPWVFCHHKDSPITIDSMARQFGKLPIQMRQWVRHVIDVPAKDGWAFEYDGTLTFVKPHEDLLEVIIHETGHSLDLSGAYADKPVSSSDRWWNNYDKDSNVPDDYAQTNAREDVAQNTVLAVFNENVKGGFKGIEPKWQNVKHQFQTLVDEAAKAGKGNSLFKPGENVKCTHRLPPSAPVSTDGSSKTRRARRDMPRVGLSKDVVHLSTGREGDDKHSGCGLHW